MKIKKQIDINRFLPGVQKNISLKNYTTFKIGGKTKYFFVAKTRKNLISAIAFAKKLKIPFFILGGGSNLLASDQGYKGLIIKIQDTKYNIQDTKIAAGAGVMLAELLRISAKTGLTGLEWAAGIPGTVGGAIYGNTGSFGKSMKDIIKEVEVFDTKTEEISVFKNKDCKFDYRDSIFKRNKNLIILSVKIQLKKRKKKEIQKKIKEYLNYKKEKQPLNYPSAGSIFKNPYKAEPSGYRQKSKIPTRPSLRAIGKNQNLLKKYPEFKKFNKIGEISVGWLIEKCGLAGKKIGDAKISEKHANFIVNLGGGKAKNVMRLINLAKKKVKKKFKINLEEEIQHLGFKD